MPYLQFNSIVNPRTPYEGTRPVETPNCCMQDRRLNGSDDRRSGEDPGLATFSDGMSFAATTRVSTWLARSDLPTEIFVQVTGADDREAGPYNARARLCSQEETHGGVGYRKL